MSNIKSNTSSRLLAALMSLVMILSMFPINMMTALAATNNHSDAVTITVQDEAGQPIKDATVAFTIDSVIHGDAYITDSKITDNYGVVEVMSKADFVADDFVLHATVTAVDYKEGKIENQAIATDVANFDVILESTKIQDVIIEGKTLTYNGNEQNLVNVIAKEGDVVSYKVDGAAESSKEAKGDNAKTYSIEVTVERTGKDDLVKVVQTVINPADIEDISIAGKNLAYNENMQELVALTGTFEAADTVTWTVNTQDTGSTDIPTATAVGNYSIVLTVDRGSNYNKLVTEAVVTNIVEGELDLEGLEVVGLEGTYKVKDGVPVAQPAVTVTNKGNYDLKYQLDDGDLTADESAWGDEIPTVTNAGSYIIWVKAVKDSYKDSDVAVTPAQSAVAPYNVYIAKAEQAFDFNEYDAQDESDSAEQVQLTGTLPFGKTYDFSATDTAALANGSITYKVELEEDGIASISDTGVLTVNYPGKIKVSATLSGNDNYKECVIEYTLDVYGAVSAQGQYISFADSQIDYVFGTSDIISENKATKNNKSIRGSITYAMESVEGVEINENTGKITVADYDKLAAAMRAEGGFLNAVVTATKAKSGKYGMDTASYTVTMTFETTPAEPYTLSAVDGTNDWYKTKATVTPVTGYEIAQNASGIFAETTDFNNQGVDVRYVYLKNITTGGITDQIAVNIKIDSIAPEKLNIEFSELNLIEKLGQSLGFYNPTVTITFTAEDVTSGIDHFDWTYTPETGAPVTEEIAVTIKENKATAILTLPADEAEQLHGKISFTGTDKASNEIGMTDDYVFIVDTINPELSVKYQGQAPYEAQNGEYSGAHFFNSDVSVELTVKETHFYSDDVVIKVSKDGGEATVVNPSWSDKVGTFNLEGDGDYIIYVSYTDKAGNPMEDYISETITVDKTKPDVKIDYVHDGDVQKTIFTVTEHNFRASDVVVSGTMKDITGADVAYNASQLTAVLQGASWTKNGDVYTYEYDQYVNGIYNLKMDYTDIAGWNAIQYAADEFIIDHGIPANVTIEYAKSPMDTFLEAITLGFYNPSVTVRFTAYDTTSGVESFTWSYKKQDGASVINHPEAIAETTVAANQDVNDKTKFTATITITAEEAAQYRGSLAAFATDTFKNRSVARADNGNIIVIDNVAPTMTVEYTTADRYIATTKTSYYNNDIHVTFKVTEANFYSEDVKVLVSKDGGAPYSVDSQITWGNRDENDLTVGMMTLAAPADHSGDGDYVVTVEYTDKSSNVMSKYTSDVYTIDTIHPVINVNYKNTTVVNTLKDKDNNDRKYYADTQTAVVTITEHNFVEGEVDFMIVAKDVTGAELSVDSLNSKTTWSHEGDVHTITITYPGDANYTFDVQYIDLATNEAADYATDYFTVDKTAATNLTVSYSTSILDTVLESLSFGFYNAKMTVTLTAEDSTSGVYSFLYSYKNAPGVSSMNAELINQAIQAADIQYSEDRKKATVTFEIPEMILGNDNQFNGTVEFTATDCSGNEADTLRDNTRIVVDNIAPTVQVGYNEAVNVVGDISYYNGSINATVTINEANFYADDVQIMVSKNGGAATAVTPTWTDNSVDVHVGTFTLTEDGDYIVTINYRDKSSNIMETYTSKQMTIDTKIETPTYTINGAAKTEEGGAYKGDATIGFNFEDQNFDTKTIKLTRTRFDAVEDVTDKFIKVNDQENGGNGTFTIPSEVGNDGIYILTIGMADKAGYTTESQMKFTINRYGSVYAYNEYLVSLIKDGGQYITITSGNKTAITDNLVITEYNADKLLEGSLKILITRDGEPVDVAYTTNPENINNQVGIGESGWYQYVYTISASNFEEDGVYRITLSSQYGASDIVKNDSTSIPDNSIDAKGNKLLDAMNFTVDTKAPEIRNIVNLEDAIINAQKVDVKYTIVDVGGLKSIEVILNGETIDTVSEFGDSAFNYSGQFVINERTAAQTVRLKVTDRAGNVTDTASDDFSADALYIFNDKVTVSTNFFVRWYADKPLFWGSIGAVVVLLGAGPVLRHISVKRKKKVIDK